MKDLFSKQSSEYAKFRPTYPDDLVDQIISLCPGRNLAWDAGTGNGQFANLLAPHFDRIIATDISEQQLSNAVRRSNIEYSPGDSTQVNLADHSCDLVSVAQAVHWFNFKKFYAEVKRVLKKDGIIALASYGLFRSDRKTEEIIDHFYTVTLANCWEPERKYVDEQYRNLPFPFEEIEFKPVSKKYTWNIDQMIGYFSTWSGLQKYIRTTNHNPLPELREKFLATGRREFDVEFPIFGRIGRTNSQSI